LTKLLLKSQKYLCCYCEKQIDKSDVHIEHFFEQNDYPEQTLAYESNLLASCVKLVPEKAPDETAEQAAMRLQKLSCGHKKSPPHHQNLPLDYGQLLNPMLPNSHLFSYLDGRIAPSKDAEPATKQKVIYTIKRLNLDNLVLTELRLIVINELLKKMQELPVEEQKRFLEILLDESQAQLPAFFSTIKDNFSYILEL
jgi:uncharacterized protein (TIGR02646 family)